jgi:hypothetical protein
MALTGYFGLVTYTFVSCTAPLRLSYEQWKSGYNIFPFDARLL